MACLLALVLAATVLTVPSGTKLTNAARTSPAEDFWRAALPGAPMPEAIRELLHPRAEATVPNDVKPKDDDDDPSLVFKYNDDKVASPRNEATVPTDVEPKDDGGDDDDPSLVFKYNDDKVASPWNEAIVPTDVTTKDDHDDDGDDPPPMSFKYTDYRAASPRNKAADPSPGVLKHVAGALNGSGDDNAAAASPTVLFLEDAVGVGEGLPFRSSLRAANGEAPATLAPLQLYTVRTVRAVEGSRFVVCRREAGSDGHAVYGCRRAAPARAYSVDVVGERGDAVTAAVVCHTDTSRWDPKHVALRLLDVKPGGAAVCYAVPDAKILPVKSEKRPSSA